MALPSNPNSFPSDLSLPKSTPDNCPKIKEDTKASYKGLIITPLTEEIHTTIFNSLGDKQDLKEFCETKIQFRKDIKKTSIENKMQILHTQALSDAVRMNSVFGNRYASALMKTGVTLPKEELPQVLREVLREVLRTYSSAGITNIKHLFEMGATLPEKELEQFLLEFMSEALREAQNAPPREALEKDSGVEIATVNNQYATLVSILVDMGAKLPEKKKVQFLREALKINSAAGNKLVDILVTRMEAALPKKELDQILKNVLKMCSYAGLQNAHHLFYMGGTLTEKQKTKLLLMALKNNSATGNSLVTFLVSTMKAVLPKNELDPALKYVLKMCSRAGLNNARHLVDMGATLTEKEKEKFLRMALRMNSVVGNSLFLFLSKMGARPSIKELAEAIKEDKEMAGAYGVNYYTQIMEMINKELTQALRKVYCTHSYTPNELNNIFHLAAMGAILTEEEKPKHLREALRTLCDACNNVIRYVLLGMGAKLPKEELAQFLREALRINNFNGCSRVSLLLQMGATLPEVEKAQFLLEALRSNDFYASRHAQALSEELGAKLSMEQLAKLSMEQLAEALEGARGIHSPAGSNLVSAITTVMLERALRNVMCNFSKEGLGIVLNLVNKENARLSSKEQLTQFLREALRINSAGGNKIVATLLRMGATLPDEEQPQFLRDALGLNTAAGDNHAAALGKMGATLPREELEQMLREARSTQRRVTATILEEMISKHQEPAVS